MLTDDDVVRPHDLLWLRAPQDLLASAALPAWASSEWVSSAPAVVRRDAPGERGAVPVGLRGRLRNERFAGYVARDRIVRRVTPEALAQTRAWESNSTRNPTLVNLPCMRALAYIAHRLDRFGVSWGITGSVGFALASGISTLREDSDLDLLLRAWKPLSRDEALALLSLLRSAPARIDMQVDTARGGFALAEWAGNAERIMLKTSRGPLLVANPWGTDAS